MKKIGYLLLKYAYRFIRVLVTPFTYCLRCYGVQVLDANFESIGHLSIEPDVFLRERQLKGKKGIAFMLPKLQKCGRFSWKAVCANRFLLKVWGRHFFVINSPIMQAFLSPFLRSEGLRYDPKHILATQECEYYDSESEATEIYKKSKALTNGPFCPLVSLTKEEREQGWKFLEKMGVPRHSWFVCFHCRERGFKSEESEAWAHCRNATISKLSLAIEEVLIRGGWCIRLGSPKADPLPEQLAAMPKVIDYPHTHFSSAFMDIFLVASCRFFIGNNSGLSCTASIFGTPCIWTNIVPFGQKTFNVQDINIYKLHRDTITKALKPFSAAVKPPFANSIVAQEYDRHNVELIENSAEEIKDATIEMFDRLENAFQRTAEDEILQKNFHELLTAINPIYRGTSQVGAAFLRKYQHLL